jgi:hypothetical protein
MPSAQASSLRAHSQDTMSGIWFDYSQWQEFIHPNSSLYWTCSLNPVHIVSIIQPPLSSLYTDASSMISCFLHALSEIPQVDNNQDWEIYTDGFTCVYIDHGSRAASDALQSLEDFRQQIGVLRRALIIKLSTPTALVFDGLESVMYCI